MAGLSIGPAFTQESEYDMELSNESKQELLRTIDDGALNAEIERRKKWYNAPEAQALFREHQTPTCARFILDHGGRSNNYVGLHVSHGYSWFRRDIEYLRDKLNELLAVMPKG